MSEPKNQELPPHVAGLSMLDYCEERLAAAIAESKAKDARIAELERQSRTASRNAEHYANLSVRDGEMRESAEDRLRAVSEALKEEAVDIDTHGRCHMTSERRSFVVKLRAIVEGKC